MIETPSKRALRRSEEHRPATLNVTALVDIMTIILLFLLRTLSTESVMMTPASNDLILPESSSLAPIVGDCPIVALSETEILLDGRAISALEDIDEEDPQRYRSLFRELRREVGKHRDGDASAGEETFQGTVIIQAHRDLPFDVVHRAMATCTLAEYTDIYLATYYEAEKPWAVQPEQLERNLRGTRLER